MVWIYWAVFNREFFLNWWDQKTTARTSALVCCSILGWPKVTPGSDETFMKLELWYGFSTLFPFIIIPVITLTREPSQRRTTILYVLWHIYMCVVYYTNNAYIYIYVLLIISIQTMKGGQKMQDELAFHGNGRRSTETPQERQSSSDSYTASSPSANCWNFSSLELSWDVF